ncbi:glycosyltransferase [Enterococcus sp. CR-Ec1]|uniref:glycosyltransferase n=1 Tax=Enterococcus sp. CR-Ec1 TaxID=2057791 RepID=UPI000C76F51C|nr:glycosyltransferase [Enterococcus sp. CR-Ec1]AUJ86087.1 glycosyl transferase family 1 [Enterococcus sp. CR-Ec1]
MKVLFINSVCGTGSTGRICTDLYDELTNAGHDCSIAYGRGFANQTYKTYRIGGKIDVLSHVIKSRLFDSHGFYSKRATLDFINYIERIKPDIIHMHNLHGYYLNVKILFEYLKKFTGKIIWTLHDCWTFSGHSAFIDYNENNRLVDKLYGFKGSREYPKALFNNSRRNLKLKEEIFSSIDEQKLLLITPSNWLKEMVSNTFLNKYNVKRIYNGIDMNTFNKTYSTKSNESRYVLGCANIWDKRKGLDDIYCLARRLKEENFIIVGKVKRKLEYNNITYIDKTDSVTKLVELYSNANVFINPTYQDNFPTTNIEALACGTPVITYNTGGSAEALSKNVGKVVDKGNIDDLESAIMNVKKNPSISSKCSERGKQFSKEKMFEQYLYIYNLDYKN